MSNVYSVVSFSGGMDSATLLHQQLELARRKNKTVQAIGFYYASKHNPYELRAAKAMAAELGVKYDIIDIQSIAAHLQSNLLLSGGAIPEGHYEASNMTQTVVPGRNSIFLAILLGIAQSVKAEQVTIGAHSGDHVIYPDCRPEYLRLMGRVIEEASEGTVRLSTPFMYMNKTSILELSYRGGANDGTTFAPLNVDFAKTRTCYKDTLIPCGVCGSCQERLAAFAELGIPDPSPYISRSLFPL